jgi:hypothetical protein
VDLAKKRQMTAAVGQLIIDRKFSVARKGNNLCLIKIVAKRPVVINLTYTEGGYWIEPPSREYRCTNSWYDYSEPENRFTRSKIVISQVVAQLRKSKVWDFILNKNFFEPNKFNRKVKKKLVEQEFRSILGK